MMYSRTLAGLAALLALPAMSMAQVKDINTKALTSTPTISSYPSYARYANFSSDVHFLRYSSWTYFTASTPRYGTELWRTNGTTTVRLTDLNPGPNSSSPYSLTALGGRIYFRAYSPASGYELFVYNPTTNKTTLFADFRKGPASSYPSNFARLSNGKIVCSANSGNGTEPHVSNGTAAGTMELKNIYTSTGSSYPYSFTTTFGGTTVFFAARSSTYGTELWKTNGTAAGTVMVKNIQTGSGSSSPRYFRPFGPSSMFFQAYSSATGYEGWLSNGTSAGTKVIDDWAGSSSGVSSLYTSAVAANGRLVYAGRSSTTGTELFVTNGTLATTTLLKSISAGTGSTSFYEMIRAGSWVYMAVRTSTGKYEIWRTNGTSTGTTRFATSPGSSPRYMYYSGGRLYWNAYVSGKGYELCYSNGTVAGTGVREIYAGSGSSYPYYGTEVKTGTGMVRAYSPGIGYEPRFVTGLTIKTLDLAKMTGTVTQDDRVNSITEQFGKVLFSATDGTNGSELWRSMGTSGSTYMVKNIRSGSLSGVSSYNMNAARLGNYVYFAANGGTWGTELWRSNGTSSGTKIFANLYSGSSSSSPSGMTRVGTNIFFSAYLSGKGRELCVTNGSLIKIYDIYPGAGSSSPRDFAALANGNVVFSARGTKGYELYMYNGSTVSLVKDIYVGTGSSYPQGMTSWNGRVYFSAYTTTNGRELWVTSGTSASTGLLKNIGSDTGGVQSSYPRDFAPNASAISRLYFTAYTTNQLNGMWRTTGTSAGTTYYFNFSYDVNPSVTTPVGSRNLYFRGNYSSLGWTLRRLDPAKGLVYAYSINTQGHAYPYNWTNGRARFCVQGGAAWLQARRNVVTDNQLFRFAGHGATATEIGEVRGKATLHATDPILGKTMKISGKTAIPTPINVLIIGAENNNPFTVSGGYSVYHSPTTMLVLAAFASSNWVMNVNIPNSPALTGKKAVLQNWGLNATTFPAGWNLSNGVHLTMGH